MGSLRVISVAFFIVFPFLTASGGDPWRPSAGAGEAGMGYACVMKSSFWSSFHNQANLAFSNLSAGFNYENRFGIKELGTRSAGVSIPYGKASIGAVYSYFGYPDFKRHSAGLACGLKLSDKIAAGAQVDYYSERTFGEYSNHEAVTFEAGLLLMPDENIRVGIHLFNPVPNSLRKSFLPSRLRVGAGMNLGAALFAGAEAEMSTGGSMIVRMGFEYETMKKLWIRGGFSTDNTAFSFGLGYLMNFVRMDLGFVTHEKLGVTSSASLIFEIH